jgi:hypothetical protein
MEYTIQVPESVFQRVRIKAQKEDVAVDQVVQNLLSRWIDGEIRMTAGKRLREELIALARAARGMWADRHPDQILAASRAVPIKREA